LFIVLSGLIFYFSELIEFIIALNRFTAIKKAARTNPLIIFTKE
jgi:hypothetical protein